MICTYIHITIRFDRFDETKCEDLNEVARALQRIIKTKNPRARRNCCIKKDASKRWFQKQIPKYLWEAARHDFDRMCEIVADLPPSSTAVRK